QFSAMAGPATPNARGRGAAAEKRIPRVAKRRATPFAHGGVVMTAGRLFLVSALSVSAFAALPPALVRAEDAQEVETGKHTFIGEVNANSVFVRCRASEDAYATMKLNKGDRVTVVGVRFTWLKILPPDGSFAYVPKSYINRHADGKAGRATRE